MAKSLISEDMILSRLLPVGFFAFSILLCLTRAGSVLNLGFPILAAGVGAVLYFYKPLTYLSFVMWVWLLTPLLRRMSDYQGTYHPVSVMLIAPLAVTAMSLMSILRYRRDFDGRTSLPLTVIALVLVYGFFVGLLHGGVTSAALGLANWGLPVAFALHVLILPEDSVAKARTLLRALAFGGLVIGAYGVLQFLILPPWDVFWMIQSELTSIGHPVPFQVRVFSTLNSPGPFAVYVAACFLAAFTTRSSVRWLSIIASALSLLLSLVRATWGSWAICLLLLFYWSPHERKGRFIAAAIGLVLLMAPIVIATPLGSTISDRVAGLSDASTDNSYLARRDLYASFTEKAATSLVGVGLGQTSVIGARVAAADDQTQVDATTIDSGLLDTLYSLGPLGFVLLGSIGVLLFRAWPSRSDPFAVAVFIVAFSVIPPLIFGNTLVAPMSMLLYPFLTAAIALKSDASLQDANALATDHAIPSAEAAHGHA